MRVKTTEMNVQSFSNGIDAEPQPKVSVIIEREPKPKTLLTVIMIPADKDWVVILVSFWQHFLKKGIPLTLLAFLSTEPSTGGALSAQEKFVIGGIFMGLANVLTPIACGLVNLYSFKVISIFGPSVVFIALLASYFVQDSFGLCFFFLGMIGGFGFSMVEITSRTIPNAWFCNLRGMASQIAGVGHGLGILIVPCLLREVLMKGFGYTNDYCCLLYAALCIPVIALGLAVPKLHGVYLQILSNEKPTTKVTFRDQHDAEVLSNMSLSGETPSFVLFKTFNNLVFPRVKDIVRERSLFIMVPDPAMMRTADPPWRWRKRRKRSRRRLEVGSTANFNVLGVQELHMVIDPDLEGHGCRPFYRVDIFYSANTLSLSSYSRQTNQLDYHMAVTRAMTRNDYFQEINNECVPMPEAFARIVLSMLSVGLWKQPHFILMQLALFLYYVGHFIPFVFIRDRGIEFGYGEERSFWLLYMIGCGNVAGRMASIVVTMCCFDIDYNFIFEIMLVFQGLLTLGSNYIQFFEIQIVYCFISGITMGLTALLKIGCISRNTGLLELTNAIGYEQLSQGLGIMVGTIIIPDVVMKNGSVKSAFYIAGFCLLISGVLLMPLKKLKFISREWAFDSQNNMDIPEDVLEEAQEALNELLPAKSFSFI